MLRERATLTIISLFLMFVLVSSGTITYPNKDLVVTYKTVNDKFSLAYAVCDKQSLKNATDRLCTVTLKSSLVNGTKYRRDCDLKLPKASNNNTEYRKYKIVQTSANEVLFAWKQAEGENQRSKRSAFGSINYVNENLKLNLINMSNCDVREMDVIAEEGDYYNIIVNQYEIHNLNVLTFNNGSFVVFFRNSKICKKNERCGIYYDSELRKFFNDSRGLNFWIPYDVSVELIYALESSSSPSLIQSYVLISYLFDDASIELVNAEGKVFHEHIFSWSIRNIPYRVSIFAFSYAHENLGICQRHVSSSKLDCSLIGSDGKIKFEVSVPLESRDVFALKMRNTKDNGMLVSINKPKNQDKLIVFKIKADGQIDKTMSRETEDVDCPDEYQQTMIDYKLIDAKEGSDICYNVVCREFDRVDEREEYNVEHYKVCPSRIAK